MLTISPDLSVGLDGPMGELDAVSAQAAAAGGNDRRAVPFYGGSFSPAQAYAASHPTAPPPTLADPMTSGAFGTRRCADSRPAWGSRLRQRKPQPTPSWHCSNSGMRE